MISKIEQIIFKFDLLTKNEWDYIKDQVNKSKVIFKKDFDLLCIDLELNNFIDPKTSYKLINNSKNVKEISIAFRLFVKKESDLNSLVDHINYFFNVVVKIPNLVPTINNLNNYQIDIDTITINITNELELKILNQFKNDLLDFLIESGFSKKTKINIVCLQPTIVENLINENHFSKQISPEKKENVKSIKISSNKLKTKIENFNIDKCLSLNSISKVPVKDLNEIKLGDKNIVVLGKIFEIVEKNIKDNNLIFNIKITDYKNSLYLTILNTKFSNLSIEYLRTFKIGSWVKVQCNIVENKYRANELSGVVSKIVPTEIPKEFLRIDRNELKKIEFTFHSKMSAFDGVNSASEYLDFAKNQNWDYVAITDINNVQAYPEIQKNSKGINIIYGLDCEISDDEVPIVLNSKNVLLDEATYVIFDLETSGLHSYYDEIIEFGGIKVKHGNIIDKINFFINPGFDISEKTSALTKITNQMIKEKGLSIIEGLKKIYEWIEDSVIVAHNGIEFDFQFLQTKFFQHNIGTLTNPMIDTLRLSWAINEQYAYHSLGTIARKLKINYDELTAHRANVDAEVLYEVFKHFKLYLFNNKINNLNQINEKLQNISLHKRYRGNRSLIYAKNQKGLKAIYELVSKSLTTNLVTRPKIYWKDIKPYRNDLVISCSPNEGEIFKTALNNDDKLLENRIDKYDFILISPPNWNNHLIQIGDLNINFVENAISRIIKASNNVKKLVVATSDAYYINQWESEYYKIVICTKILNGLYHRFFKKSNGNIQHTPIAHLRTTDEMIDEFKFLNDEKLIREIAYENGHKIVNQFKFANIEPLKKGLFVPKLEGANEQLKELTYKNAKLKYGDQLPDIIQNRINLELDSIINNGYGIIYWIAHLLVQKSNDDGYLVGSRGSVGSSLVATLTNISEINPLPPHYICKSCKYLNFETNVDDGFDLPTIKCPKCNNEMVGDGHDIPFETFMGLKGNKVPDIDLNFSGEYQTNAHNYVKKLFGESHTLRAGTISTAAEKTTFGNVRNYFNDFAQIDFIRQTEVERYVKGLLGIKKTTGQHPGGIMVFPKENDITDFTPYNYPADDISSEWKTTHFAFEFLHDSLLKLDILGHDDPTMLKMLKDITGIDPISIPNYDKNVLKLFSGLESLKINSQDLCGEKTGALGIPEFGTDFVRRMLIDAKPISFADLIRVSGLSHGTDVWNNNAQVLIQKHNLKLHEVIACRDDIMVFLKKCGLNDHDAFDIMELVRKGKSLPKDKIDLMLEHNIPEWYINSCQKIKYMFPKAHAAAYVLTAWRIAWFKINYPLQYYATLCSIKIKEHDISKFILGKNAIIEELQSIRKKLNNPKTKKEVTSKQSELVSTYEIYLEMIARGCEITPISIEKSMAKEFIVLDNKVVPPFSTIQGLGEVAAESIIIARKESPFVSIEDLAKRTKLNKTHINQMREINILDHLPEDNSIKLF
ncbi:PolC-type DNA polymerase III [Mycoplasmoides pirum]|uniref:PolC-type DNA polymerase III n=1 Tax=Mycoplasmoides pirum TaxID=2122 RepID=UPI0005650EC8|nr:PolC-type DNA polymerase III [Mycoplasmoides pirum]